MESSPLNTLPLETLHQIFSLLPLRLIAAVKSTCKALNSSLSSPSFLHLLQSHHSLSLLALRPPNRHLSSDPTLHAFDHQSNQWLRFSLSFLPYTAFHPIASSSDGLLYLWATTEIPQNPPVDQLNSPKALVVCNPLTGKFKTLHQLERACSRHSSVLVGSGRVIVVSKLGVLCNFGGDDWLKFESNILRKRRSPVLISDFVLALFDVGLPWRTQWAMFIARIGELEKTGMRWETVEREWRDIFDILDCPRLVRAGDDGKNVYMVGGLKTSAMLRSACSTILILRLDLESLEWDEAGRMPAEMYRCSFNGIKYKVFGVGNRVCFSANKIGKLALWEDVGQGKEEWRWVEDVPGSGDELYCGLVFEGRIDAEV